MDAKQGEKKAPKRLSEVLNINRDVFERARALLPSIPEGSKRGAPPATLADAMAQIQERQQSQAAAKDPKAKSKAGPAHPADQAVPGARIGGSVPNSAFWTLVEVSWCSAPECERSSKSVVLWSCYF
jgi:nucleoid-associated protein YgaU